MNLIFLFIKRRYNASSQLSRVGSTPPAPTGAHRDIEYLILPASIYPSVVAHRTTLPGAKRSWISFTIGAPLHGRVIPHMSGSVPPPQNHAGCFRGTSSVQSYARSHAWLNVSPLESPPASYIAATCSRAILLIYLVVLLAYVQSAIFYRQRQPRRIVKLVISSLCRAFQQDNQSLFILETALLGLLSADNI